MQGMCDYSGHVEVRNVGKLLTTYRARWAEITHGRLTITKQQPNAATSSYVKQCFSLQVFFPRVA